MNTEQPELKRLHVLIKGRVQGVGFRHFVVSEVHSRLPNVNGRVRNLPDGRVEMIAEGPEDELQTLLAILQHGPRWSAVQDVTEQWGVSEGDVGSRFDVSHYDGRHWMA